MNSVAIRLLAGAVALMLAGPVSAQVVTPVPSLNSDAAKTAAEACIAMATKNDWRVSVTVVDAAGNMLYMRRMDGAPILSVEPTRMKAETALRQRRPASDVIAELARETDRGAVMAMNLNTFTAGGGLPIVVNGEVVGAIGVGGSPDDNACAKAAVAAIVK